MRKSALQEAYNKVVQAQQTESEQKTEQHQGNAANDGHQDEDIIDADFEEVSNG
jgi:molecular chaperone DnaK